MSRSRKTLGVVVASATLLEGGGAHTAATADETAKVTAAVKAKDATVTITKVQKDADGSFDAHGTKAGAHVSFDVSADYATVTERTGGRGGHGPGGKGGAHTAATAAETAQVKAAVKAKDATVTVTEVRKDADGSFDALGTKAGARVMVEVSKDLKTVEVRTGGPGGRGDHGNRGAAPSGTTPSGSSTSTS